MHRAGDERSGREGEGVAIELADARQHFGTISRLNSIAAMGAPIGDALGMRIEELGCRVIRCALDAPITLDLVPRCPKCGFMLGTAAPASELGEVFEEMRRALETKLAAVSPHAH